MVRLPAAFAQPPILATATGPGRNSHLDHANLTLPFVSGCEPVSSLCPPWSRKVDRPCVYGVLQYLHVALSL
jgi:hypothetical protein